MPCVCVTCGHRDNNEVNSLKEFDFLRAIYTQVLDVHEQRSADVDYCASSHSCVDDCLSTTNHHYTATNRHITTQLYSICYIVGSLQLRHSHQHGLVYLPCVREGGWRGSANSIPIIRESSEQPRTRTAPGHS